jgi:hypothetical protein
MPDKLLEIVKVLVFHVEQAICMELFVLSLSCVFLIWMLHNIDRVTFLKRDIMNLENQCKLMKKQIERNNQKQSEILEEEDALNHMYMIQIDQLTLDIEQKKNLKFRMIIDIKDQLSKKDHTISNLKKMLCQKKQRNFNSEAQITNLCSELELGKNRRDFLMNTLREIRIEGIRQRARTL